MHGDNVDSHIHKNVDIQIRYLALIRRTIYADEAGNRL